jgi:hypothetical protein
VWRTARVAHLHATWLLVRVQVPAPDNGYVTHRHTQRERQRDRDIHRGRDRETAAERKRQCIVAGGGTDSFQKAQRLRCGKDPISPAACSGPEIAACHSDPQLSSSCLCLRAAACRRRRDARYHRLHHQPSARQDADGRAHTEQMHKWHLEMNKCATTETGSPDVKISQASLHPHSICPHPYARVQSRQRSAITGRTTITLSSLTS